VNVHREEESREIKQTVMIFRKFRGDVDGRVWALNKKTLQGQGGLKNIEIRKLMNPVFSPV